MEKSGSTKEIDCKMPYIFTSPQEVQLALELQEKFDACVFYGKCDFDAYEPQYSVVVLDDNSLALERQSDLQIFAILNYYEPDLDTPVPRYRFKRKPSGMEL